MSTPAAILNVFVFSTYINLPVVVDGEWSGWMPWGACSRTCGNGTSMRTRLCDDPAPQHGGMLCNGTGMETQDCDLGGCPGLCSSINHSGVELLLKTKEHFFIIAVYYSSVFFFCSILIFCKQCPDKKTTTQNK